MKTSLSIGLLFGVLLFHCGVSPVTHAADQVQTSTQSDTVTLATPFATTHATHTNLVTSTRVKSAQDEQPFSVSLESPIDQSIEIGGTAGFSVNCTWPDALFQWLFQCERIPNATNSSLVVPKLRFEDAGYYTCVVYRGFDFEMSKPMQLLVFERKGDDIIVAAKVPPGLGGMWDAPIKAEKKTTQVETDDKTLQAGKGTGNGGMLPTRALLGSSLMSLAQLTFLMQSTGTNTATGATIVSGAGFGCPRPYQGYIRFTTGWYPRNVGPWTVAGTGGASTYSAITFDDTTRQGCFSGNVFDLINYTPLKARPHRFVCFFSTTPSSTTTYFIKFTGFL